MVRVDSTSRICFTRSRDPILLHLPSRSASLEIQLPPPTGIARPSLPDPIGSLPMPCGSQTCPPLVSTGLSWDVQLSSRVLAMTHSRINFWESQAFTAASFGSAAILSAQRCTAEAASSQLCSNWTIQNCCNYAFIDFILIYTLF